MARAIKSPKMDSATARTKLKASGKPVYCEIARGLHLGYRKGAKTGEKWTGGNWVMRRYVGDEKYLVETIAQADDKQPADGLMVLSFDQARERARERFKEAITPGPAPIAAPFTVNEALDRYFARLEADHSKSLGDARNRAANHIRPELGAK
ncbi:MAG TPA: site-specific integrase, partial [Methylocystis sp.]|nr:site-specific integrase [Methylocystis sp.]